VVSFIAYNHLLRNAGRCSTTHKDLFVKRGFNRDLRQKLGPRSDFAKHSNSYFGALGPIRRKGTRITSLRHFKGSKAIINCFGLSCDSMRACYKNTECFKKIPASLKMSHIVEVPCIATEKEPKSIYICTSINRKYLFIPLACQS